MKLSALCGFFISSGLVFMTTAVHADDLDGSRQGIQNTIDQHDKSIEQYKTDHPEKDLPRGLVHSREVLEKIMAGERPERPELPDVAMRPDRPVKPARPARPEKPEMARR